MATQMEEVTAADAASCMSGAVQCALMLLLLLMRWSKDSATELELAFVSAAALLFSMLPPTLCTSCCSAVEGVAAAVLDQ